MASQRLGSAVFLAVVAGTIQGAAAQPFINGDFAAGDLSGWTVQLTENGATFLQTVATFDIDGVGPLAAGPAGNFQVGRATTTGAATGGVDLTQPLELTGGVEYAVAYLAACDTTMTATSNADGGRFVVLFDGAELGLQTLGSISAGCRKYTFVEGRFTPAATGTYNVGARIVRGFLVSGVRQYVDNFDLRPAANGSCCQVDGACVEISELACAARGGVYMGNQTVCASTTCPAVPMGACCLNDGTCAVMSRAGCEITAPIAGMGFGSFQGAGVACASVTCPTLLHTSFTGYTATEGVTEVNSGAFLDLTSVSAALEVTRLDYISNAAAGNWTEMQVWTFPGSYVGNDASQAGWTLHETLTVRSVGSGTTSRTMLALNTPIEVGPGQTVGVYLIAAGGGVRYRGTDAAPATQTTFADASLSVFTDRARTAPWGGTLRLNRSWSGSVHYVLGGGPPACYANCDESTQAPVLNVADFGCFLTRYAAGDAYANCDESTQPPVLNVADFGCFLTKYAAGCP